jgi:hypothetical protein
MSYRQLSSSSGRIRMELQFHPDPAAADDGQRNCPKHVQFYFQNKFLRMISFSDRSCR